MRALVFSFAGVTIALMERSPQYAVLNIQARRTLVLSALGPVFDVTINGVRFRPDSILLGCKGAEIRSVEGSGWVAGGVSFDDNMCEKGWPPCCTTGGVFNCDPAIAESIRQRLWAVAEIWVEARERFADPAFAAQVKNQIVALYEQALAPDRAQEAPPSNLYRSHRDIVRSVEDYIDKRPAARMLSREVSMMLGVSAAPCTTR
ncbi:MAG: hypothetical protein KGM42_07700 [Hyphomicrobiales bacterium]|nr:hypothetical protein [Hyphomicrobiales bacterium]